MQSPVSGTDLLWSAHLAAEVLAGCGKARHAALQQLRRSFQQQALLRVHRQRLRRHHAIHARIKQLHACGRAGCVLTARKGPVLSAA